MLEQMRKMGWKPRPPRTNLKGLLFHDFSGLNIAEPLLSFDASSDLGQVRRAMESAGVRLVGIRRGGLVVGYLATSADEAPTDGWDGPAGDVYSLTTGTPC